MGTATTIRLINELDALKTRFGPTEAKKVQALLERFSRQEFHDTELLISFHELLLFVRAYPRNASILRMTEEELRTFPDRVSLLCKQDIDLSVLEVPEVSGIAGAPVTDTFSFYIVRWLLRRHAAQVVIDWDWFEDEYRLADAWPRFMPLLTEDTLVEANVPYREWLLAACQGKRELEWLFDRFKELPLSDVEKAEIYNGQKIYVRWNPGFRATRTGMRQPVGEIYYHRGPLIQRRDVRMNEELAQSSPPLQKLSEAEGEKALDMAREASTVRYRELYGFTHGDPKHVYQTKLGRGVDLLMMGVPKDKRLPWRAYHAAMIYKNGVPIGYFEGISLFERMESGFNLYYTFRDGETAWLYARTLNVMRHFTGVTAFSLDPYQIGHENEEGIESGAFWFYRKLGFRPTRTELLRLAEKEEQKIATRNRYRTSAATLRKLAAGPMIFQLNEEQSRDWDRFQIRNVGLAVERRMARDFGGSARRMRQKAVRFVQRVLGTNTSSLTSTQSVIFSDFAVVLSLISDLNRWSEKEKQLLLQVIRAKAGPEEKNYLKQMQRHDRLRSEIIKLGSQQ